MSRVLPPLDKPRQSSPFHKVRSISPIASPHWLEPSKDFLPSRMTHTPFRDLHGYPSENRHFPSDFQPDIDDLQSSPAFYCPPLESLHSTGYRPGGSSSLSLGRFGGPMSEWHETPLSTEGILGYGGLREDVSPVLYTRRAAGVPSLLQHAPCSWPPEFTPSDFHTMDAGLSPKPFSPLGPAIAGAPMADMLDPSSSVSDDVQNVFDMSFGSSVFERSSAHYDDYGALLSNSPVASISEPSSCASSPASHTIDISSNPGGYREPSPHTSEPHENPRRRFPCLLPGCNRRFTSQYTLKVHMEAHKPKPRVTFPCTLGCSERFSRQHDRLRHEVAKHGKVCEFSCDDCGRFFSSKKTLGNHKCPVAQNGTRWVHS